jgi:hypothetical protein
VTGFFSTARLTPLYCVCVWGGGGREMRDSCVWFGGFDEGFRLGV